MRTYARLDQGSVVELLTTDGDILAMFHPELHWVDVTDVPAATYGWRLEGAIVVPPQTTAGAADAVLALPDLHSAVTPPAG
jgi:hypothetical protein